MCRKGVRPLTAMVMVMVMRRCLRGKYTLRGGGRYAPIHSRLQVRAQRDTRKVHTVFTHWNYMMQRSRRLPN